MISAEPLNNCYTVNEFSCRNWKTVAWCTTLKEALEFKDRMINKFHVDPLHVVILSEAESQKVKKCETTLREILTNHQCDYIEYRDPYSEIFGLGSTLLTTLSNDELDSIPLYIEESGADYYDVFICAR